MLETTGMGFLRFVLRRLAVPRRKARLVRRVEMRCPHTAETAVIDLLMGPTGHPSMVLRCSRRRDAPPECDQLCRSCAEAVTNVARSLLLVPAGDGPPEEVD
jgi:hypothetical protein